MFLSFCRSAQIYNREGESKFTVTGLDRPIIHKELPQLIQGYDCAVIDGAPRVSDLTRSAILAVELVLVPVQPSPLDIWAAHEVLKEEEEELKAQVVKRIYINLDLI